MGQKKISLKHHNNYCLFHQENLHCRISVDKFDHLQKLQNLSNYSMKTNGNTNRWTLTEQTSLQDCFLSRQNAVEHSQFYSFFLIFFIFIFSEGGASSQEAVRDFLSLHMFSVPLMLFLPRRPSRPDDCRIGEFSKHPFHSVYIYTKTYHVNTDKKNNDTKLS